MRALAEGAPAPGPAAAVGAAAAPQAAGDYRLGPRLLVLSAAVGLAAVNTGNNLLYLMLSLVLALAVVSLAAARWSLRRLRVAPLLPDEATRGEPFLVGAEVTGRFPFLPQTWVRVRFDGLPERFELTVPVPAEAGRGVASSRVTVSRRGVYEDLSLVAITGYPLDLSEGRAKLPWRGSLVVLPRFERIAALRVGRAAGAGGRAGAAAPARRAGGTGAELYNIREYSAHDDARHIDWRSTARVGRLMVRELEREQERRIDLVLDRVTLDPDAFEAAVERAAAILDLARRARFDARLLVPGAAAPLAGRDAMRALAAVAPDPAADAAASEASLNASLSLARRGAEVVVISANPSRATPIEMV